MFIGLDFEAAPGELRWSESDQAVRPEIGWNC
ncbi:MAG: hypothetical protein ACI9WU_001957, partial [Myxococcota bacterium]